MNKRSRPAILGLGIIVILLLGVLAGLLGLWSLMTVPISPGDLPVGIPGITQDTRYGIILEVFSGESASHLGRRLEMAGLIRSRFLWEIMIRINREPIKAGVYALTTDFSVLDLHKLLVSGKQLVIRVTIPEGLTLSKVAAILEQEGICRSTDFLKVTTDPQLLQDFQIPARSFEGYVFPDTYYFPWRYPAVSVLKMMVHTFFKRFSELATNQRDLSPERIHQMVTLASIVEREYRLPEEAPRIAGVFYNRLQRGMALQSCATVEYVITEILHKPHPRVLYYQDLEIQNPYNTYLHRGLPPGPIANPGVVALKAVLYPEKTEYLYF
ncbi:MAG: endolytic transglycosylase MltG, partial [Treponemataceae bacterium]|nr:endolytic transglycosylase MltG [Treponemataceae bacterium]